MRTLIGRVFQAQALIALLALLVAALFFDVKSVKAAIIAWIIAAVPALVYARVISRIHLLVSAAQQLLFHALGEALKIAFSVLALIVVFATLKNELSITYFLGTYIACLMGYGIALLFK